MPRILIHDLPASKLAEYSRVSDHKVGIIPAKAVPSGDIQARRKSELNVNWGRAYEPTWSASLFCLGIMILSPLLVIFSWVTLSQYQGSLFNSTIAMYSMGPSHFIVRYSPIPSVQIFGVYALWLLFQAALYNFLPARLSTGQLTPAGYLLRYHTNGLSAWILTHIALGLGVFHRLIDPTWIAKNWSGLLVAINAYGFLLSAFAYVKAYVAPTHSEDRKFSGNVDHTVRVSY
jgi:7-dehydrocholesterol reductase